MKKPILHIRPAQRVDAVEVKELQLGKPISPKSVPEPGIVSPDSANERSSVQMEANALIAELDKGLLEA